jgi:hypothetical protein
VVAAHAEDPPFGDATFHAAEFTITEQERIYYAPLKFSPPQAHILGRAVAVIGLGRTRRRGATAIYDHREQTHRGRRAHHPGRA